ncbi:MAG: hypothetical protein ABI771_07350 [Betaproteobacteria bacterium]
MEHGTFDRYIEPPPRLIAAAEALPHLGGLKLAAYGGALPDEIEAHPVKTLDDAFDEAKAQEMSKRAFGMQKVRDRLGRGRVTPIGVSRRGELAKGERRTYLVVAYDYTANVAVEISLDEQGELLGISDQHYQPPPIQSEIDRAIELARAHDRLATKLDGLVAMAIPFSGANNEWVNRRVIEVLFGCRTERLPKYRAWVDLGTESVLHAGESCECCGQSGGVQS